MLSHSARAVLNAALQQYRAGTTEPILVGGIAQLKPAMRLIMAYRLVIQEGERVEEVVTSYTRWLECVQAKEGREQQIYVAFSPRFERIWLESKKPLPESWNRSRPMRCSGASTLCASTVGRKAT